MMYSPFDIRTQLKPYRVCGRMMSSHRISKFHQQKYIPVRIGRQGYLMRCGQGNGGTLYRFAIPWFQISGVDCELQSKLPKGATLAPVIIATDKTQLTQFSGNKSAYPVYLTIGNIPKALRRKPSKHACILIAYLSVDKVDRTKMTDIEHCSRVQRVFHESMRTVLEPLVEAGNQGVEMVGSDGAW